jgi:hypothetical protein
VVVEGTIDCFQHLEVKIYQLVVLDLEMLL